MTAVTGVNLIRAVVGEFLAYYGHWLIKKHRCLESFLFSSIGQAVFSSRAYLSKNTHWAKTEDLLDKYSKVRMMATPVVIVSDSLARTHF